jgi:predicted MFS family arabinose efflux permease
VTRAEGLAVWLLALGLLLIYAGTYYAFPALLPALEADTGWGKPALALGPTLGSLSMAVFTPLTGRVVDAGHGRRMLILLPPVAVAALAGLALAPNPIVWWLCWVLIGAAQAGCVYETVFSLLTRRLGVGARAAITRITMLAGLSGTMTFPLGHWLGATFGGQRAYFGFAALALFGTLPLYAVAVRLLGPDRVAATSRAEMPGSAVRAALLRPAFWGIAAIFAAAWMDHGLLLTYILPLFHDRGVVPATATLAAACIGPAQLSGRMVLILGGSRIRNSTVTKGALVLVALAAVTLLLAGMAPGLVFLVVFVQGAGMGLMSIMRPMLLVDVLGRRGFGAISGLAAVPPILAGALAPTLGAQLLAVWGPMGIYLTLVALSVFSLGLALAMLKRAPLEG